MSESKSIITVSRLWHEPRIKVSISHAGISIAMGLDDYISALLTEIGSPFFVLTKKQLQEKMEAAAERVQMEMQQQSAKIV